MFATGRGTAPSSKNSGNACRETAFADAEKLSEGAEDQETVPGVLCDKASKEMGASDTRHLEPGTLCRATRARGAKKKLI